MEEWFSKLFPAVAEEMATGVAPYTWLMLLLDAYQVTKKDWGFSVENLLW